MILLIINLNFEIHYFCYKLKVYTVNSSSELYCLAYEKFQ